MPVKKKRVSDMPLAHTLKGLFTLGVDAQNRSVKVGLEFVETAANRANIAAGKAQEIATHPTYIGADYYVYEYDLTAKKHKKTNVYVKGPTGDNGGAEAIVRATFAELEVVDAAEGTLAIVAGGNAPLREGMVTDKFTVNTGVVPSFDWAQITPDANGGYMVINLVCLHPVELTPVFVMACSRDAGVDFIQYAIFEAEEIIIWLYASQDYDSGETIIPAGWQVGAESINIGHSGLVKLNGELDPGTPIHNVLANFDSLFSTPSAANTQYVRLGGAWVPIAFDPAKIPTTTVLQDDDYVTVAQGGVMKMIKVSDLRNCLINIQIVSQRVDQALPEGTKLVTTVEGNGDLYEPQEGVETSTTSTLIDGEYIRLVDQFGNPTKITLADFREYVVSGAIVSQRVDESLPDGEMIVTTKQ